MSWISISIDVDCSRADPLADLLFDLGAVSTSIEDADAGTPEERPQFGEPGESILPLWQHARVLALFEAGIDPDIIVALCAERLGWDEIPPYHCTPIAEENWVEKTQAQFEPIQISNALWIVPSWHTPPHPEAIVLRLDPGMAFGTGSHPTTQLCLQWLERHVFSGCSLLDYGCGSGILAMAGAKFGAGAVTGLDIDPQAVVAAERNALENGLSLTLVTASTALQGQFDIVVANILSNPLKLLAPALAGYVRAGGWLALSGILAEQAEELIAVYAPFIRLSIDKLESGWVCLAGQKEAS